MGTEPDEFDLDEVVARYTRLIAVALDAMPLSDIRELVTEIESKLDPEPE